jgi:hypothetical protein
VDIGHHFFSGYRAKYFGSGSTIAGTAFLSILTAEHLSTGNSSPLNDFTAVRAF